MITHVLQQAKTNRGTTLADLSSQNKVLIIFLRQLGCTFCREALQNISNNIAHYKNTNTTLVFVYPYHDDNAAQVFFSKYNLENEHRIGNANGSLYESFDLQKGSTYQLVGPQVWWPFIKGLFTKKVGLGKITGDYTRLGGAFLLHKGHVVQAFRAKTSAENADFANMAACEV